MNLLDLITNTLKKVATTHGGEYAGPCPGCGGRDRFRVWPEEGNTGRYWCRQCGKQGDAIQYLRDFKGLSFQEACLETKQNPLARKEPRTRPGPGVSWQHRESERQDNLIKESLWDKNIKKFLIETERALWTDKGQKVRDWLYHRGLREETIKKARIGLNTQDRFFNRESWGLSRKVKETGNLLKLWLPQGLTIPFFTSGRILRLRIRLMGPKADMRYYLLPGGDTRPMVWGSDKKVFCVVESELDGLLLYQEAGDIIGIVALGAAQVRPDQENHLLLSQADRILFALDWDNAGREQFKWWKRVYSTVIPWPIPIRKDPSEAFQDGLAIRTWILTGINKTESNEPVNKTVVNQDRDLSEISARSCRIKPFPESLLKNFNQVELERLAIMTADGGLTDEEALGLMLN
jgi:DNA primase